MRLRYRSATYRYYNRSQQQLERYYREILHDALSQSQQSAIQRSTTWRPMADIRESADMVTIKIELAGLSEDDFDVTLYEDALIVSGVRRDDSEHGEYLYHEAQIRYGPFRVEVLILSPFDSEHVAARYENGFLWVDLPKKLPEEAQQRISMQQRATEE